MGYFSALAAERQEEEECQQEAWQQAMHELEEFEHHVAMITFHQQEIELWQRRLREMSYCSGPLF